MSSRPAPLRRRLLVGTATGALLLGSGLAAVATAGPVAAAAPGECDVAFPVSEVAAGQEVTGSTVVSGATPTGFTGSVIGVLENGVAPGRDMVLVDLDMPEFARTGGVWAGMSGSPVYAADGRLLGAVAYGLTSGSSPIAGVTPYEDMDDYLDADAPQTVAVPAALAGRVAQAAGVSRAEARQGLDQLPVPTTVSGVGSRRLAQVIERAGKRTGLDADTVAVGTAAAAPGAGPETIVPGGNLAVSASYGDILIGGVGTATSVCGDRVVGFGHPAFFTGGTSLGLHPASALVIQPNQFGPAFKVANISGPAGTITDDRLAGITGTLGALPDSATVTSAVTYGNRARTGSSELVDDDYLLETTVFEVLSNADGVIDGVTGGTALQTWTFTGTQGATPFSLSFTDRHTSSDDVTGAAAFSLFDVAYSLSSLPDVEIDDVDVQTAADASEATYQIGAVQQRRNGRWVTVSRKSPVLARAGQKVRLRVQLGGTAGARTLPVPPVTIPRSARGGAVLAVQGGNDTYTDLYGTSLASLSKKVAAAQRHDEVRVQLGSPRKIDFGGGFDDGLFFRPGARGRNFLATRTLGPLDHVVGGGKLVQVLVR